MARLKVSTYVQQSLAPSTHAAYAADLKQFLAWGGTIPAPPRMVARYLAQQAERLKCSTLCRHLASIVRAHSVKGLPSPWTSPLVKSTIRGIKRVHGGSVKRAHALSSSMLKKISAPLKGEDRLRNIRDRALLLVGFAGGFRRSEIVSLKVSDLTFSKRGVVIRLRSSKTDANHRGRDIAIAYTRTKDCPVLALKDWVRAACPDHVGGLPLFRRIDRYGFLRESPLCGASVGWILRQRLKAHGLDTKGYSAHSLRAGFVTSSVKVGTPTWAIQRQTGHRTEQMVHRYIRGMGLFDHNPSAALMG
ncbi:MAG: tyrosine-type recombinase/integrase [Polaromonas sp.]|uniref:site-specific integrase n=1 Tax=Polaromonas sp. TaxID=1869339 RepID=UPI0025D3C65B|nr:tyrosine-type recombinase/integrase [Polaromonas sp.]MBI2727156.1 tyrosine-type recombinase/integrase [Polaromonas sp.]